MFKRRTLFVLGAGSSSEVGFPVGTELAAIVRKKTNILFEDGFTPVGDADFSLFGQVTHTRRAELRQFQQAAWLIRDGITLTKSIDDFIDLHRTNERLVLLGKAAIVKSILEAEKNSTLYVNRDRRELLDTSRIAGTWFVKFMQMLGRGVQKENVSGIFDNLMFVVFNYDRCVEHFLTHALQTLYGIDLDIAAEIVSKLYIIHPYGTLANIPFGGNEYQNYDYARLGSQIKTYSEQISDPTVLTGLTNILTAADCVVFLGFAYHSQNMMLLKPSPVVKRVPVFGTAYKMSNADVEVVEQQILEFFAPAQAHRLNDKFIRLENELKSADLFDSYSKSLSGGD
jgi:hypothetical protein